MPQMNTMPILAAPPAPQANGVAAAPPAGRDKAQQTAASAPGTAKTAGETKGDGPAPAERRGDSFAAVLGRHLAKDADAAKGRADGAIASLALERSDAAATAADPNLTETETKPGEGEHDPAAGMASLMPMLQALLPGAALPRPELKGDAKTDLKADVKIDGKSEGRKAPAGLPSGSLSPLATEDGPGLAIQSKQGEARPAPPQATLVEGDLDGKQARTAAIPAAAPLAAKPVESRSDSTDPGQANFANLLANAQAPTSHGQLARAATPLTVDAPMGSRGWDSNVGEKLVWMVGRQQQQADLVLNPPQLGKVEVSISMNGDQANAQFVSANPAVRDALEAAMPRLRDMLADAGINLGQAQVGSGAAQQSPGGSANNRENGDNPGRGSSVAGQLGALGQAGTAGTWLRTGTGMVDVFA